MQSDQPPPAFVLRSSNRWTGDTAVLLPCAPSRIKTQASGTKLLGFDLNNQSRGMGLRVRFMESLGHALARLFILLSARGV